MLRYILFPIVSIIFLLSGFAPAYSQEQAFSPPRGDPLRKTLMNTLRTPVQKELKKSVIFKVNKLIVLKNFAFMEGVPLRPGGLPMDYHGTRYQKEIDEGVFDDQVCALFQKQGKKWVVIMHRIGGTDVCGPDPETVEKYKVPAEFVIR